MVSLWYHYGEVAILWFHSKALIRIPLGPKTLTTFLGAVVIHVFYTTLTTHFTLSLWIYKITTDNNIIINDEVIVN